MVQTFHAKIRQDGDKFIAECLEIDISGEGNTKQEAFMDLRDALFIHFEDLRPFLKIYLRAL